MKSSSGYEIYHNTLSACLDEVERYVQSKGYQVGDYFPLINHISYGQTERTQLEMLKNGKVANTLAIQIYRMDSGRYELNCYPVKRFAKGDIVGRTMHEFKRGQLHSSSGQVVTNPKQAVAIGLSKQRRGKFKSGGKVLWGVKKGEPDWKEQIITEQEERIEDAKKWATANGFDRFRIQTIDLTTPPDFKKTFKNGGYTRPAYDLKTTGDYLFHTDKGQFKVTSYLFERQNDTEDALEIQDELRGELGSIIIKNSAWKNLASGKSVKARTSKGNFVGTLKRIDGGKKFSGGGSTDDGIDLFEDYENIPPEVQAILDKYSEGIEEGNYQELQKAVDELNSIGYTFEYYLDGVPYDLRPIGSKGKVDEYGTGGGVKSLKVGNKYLYKFNNKTYEVLAIGEKQVAISPLPLGSFWNDWIVSKSVMEKWIKNKTMIKQK